MAKRMVYHLQMQPNKTFKPALTVGVTEVVFVQLNKLNSRAALYLRRAATGKTFVDGIDSCP